PVEILPFLYLGCAEHSSSKSVLEELNITAILNVTKNCPNYFEDSLDYKNIPIDDSLNADIQKWFDDAVGFIAKVRSLHGKVLVHCVGGVSRSATICIAYLVHAYSYSVNQAYDYVKKKRPIISPNLNFMGQLMAYQSR
ncbi:uncharacterized protein TRIADDRAFT_14780, partial [Trichoplax adhaerens]